MKILLLTPTPDKLKPIIEATGDKIVEFYDNEVNLVVSYNWRKRVPLADLNLAPHINLHISLLPFNRGADPNFWSHFDNTSKGVSIHYMDSGIDTGPLLAQEQLALTGGHTLRSSYDALHAAMVDLFNREWSRLRYFPGADAQPEGGSSHRSHDKDPFFAKLPLKWDTPVAHVEELGMTHHAGAGFWRKYEEEIANLPKQE